MLKISLMSGISILFLFYTSFFLLPSSISQITLVASTESYWSDGAPMPTARSEITSAVLANKIYVIGGFENGHSTTSTMEVYDPITNKWTTALPLPQPLDHTAAAAAAFDGKLYVVGGGYLNRDNLSNKLFIYDPVTNNWTGGASLPNARGALTANFINEILYAVGGVDNQKTLNSLLAYDPTTNTWTEKAPMPTAREHLTSAVVNGKLYVIGGRTNGMSTNVDANEVYDPIADKWTILEPMPSKRGGLASAAIEDNGNIYVFGGEQPTGTFNNNEKYDTTTNKWSLEMSMPTARHGLAAASIGDKIYVIGGGPQPGGSAINFNEIFHVNSGR